MTVAGDEELGSERVTEGEPEERQPGRLKTIMEHLELIFAEGCLHVDRPAKTTYLPPEDSCLREEKATVELALSSRPP
jgi:hypothetical protein